MSRVKGKSKKEELKDRFLMYVDAMGDDPVPLRRVASWMIKNGLYDRIPFDLEGHCAKELAIALRQDFIADSKNRAVRKWLHFKKSENMIIDGMEQGELDLWIDIETARPELLRIAMQQRRRGILGDCRQCEIDREWINENRMRDNPIQMSFNFDEDLLEEMQPATYDGIKS